MNEPKQKLEKSAGQVLNEWQLFWNIGLQSFSMIVLKHAKFQKK